MSVALLPESTVAIVEFGSLITGYSTVTGITMKITATPAACCASWRLLKAEPIAA